MVNSPWKVIPIFIKDYDPYNLKDIVLFRKKVSNVLLSITFLIELLTYNIDNLMKNKRKQKSPEL